MMPLNRIIYTRPWSIKVAHHLTNSPLHHFTIPQGAPAACLCADGEAPPRVHQAGGEGLQDPRQWRHHHPGGAHAKTDEVGIKIYKCF